MFLHLFFYKKKKKSLINFVLCGTFHQCTFLGDDLLYLKNLTGKEKTLTKNFEN